MNYCSSFSCRITLRNSSLSFRPCVRGQSKDSGGRVTARNLQKLEDQLTDRQIAKDCRAPGKVCSMLEEDPASRCNLVTVCTPS